MKIYEWTAKNNSSYLRGTRSAKTLRKAIIDARRYVIGELGSGAIYYYERDTEVNDDCNFYLDRPIRIDTYRGGRWVVITDPDML